MLKKTLTYKDFEDRDVTETCYFNLTKTELISMALGLPDVDTADVDVKTAGSELLRKLGGEGVFEFIKDLVKKSYGVKSSDGRRFIKTPELTEEFTQTLAYDNLVMELMSNDEAASEFVNGIIPTSVLEEMIARQESAKSEGN